jgi:hypothetical protein
LEDLQRGLRDVHHLIDYAAFSGRAARLPSATCILARSSVRPTVCSPPSTSIRFSFVREAKACESGMR